MAEESSVNVDADVEMKDADESVSDLSNQVIDTEDIVVAANHSEAEKTETVTAKEKELVAAPIDDDAQKDGSDEIVTIETAEEEESESPLPAPVTEEDAVSEIEITAAKDAIVNGDGDAEGGKDLNGDADVMKEVETVVESVIPRVEETGGEENGKEDERKVEDVNPKKECTQELVIVDVEMEQVSEAKEQNQSPTENDLKTENIKNEKVASDSYAVLEDIDSSDNEGVVKQEDISDISETDEEELTENEKLRRTNSKLSMRIMLLEEFIELEFGDKFAKFLQNRERLVNVMGLNELNECDSSGMRPDKSTELVGLLKIVKDQAISNGGSSKLKSEASGSESKTKSVKISPSKQRYQERLRQRVEAKEKKESPKRSEVVSSSSIQPKRCHQCNKVDHLVKDCPVKRLKSKTRLHRQRQRERSRENRRRRAEENEASPQLKKLRQQKKAILKSIRQVRRTTVN